MSCIWGPAIIWRAVAVIWEGTDNSTQAEQRSLKGQMLESGCHRCGPKPMVPGQPQPLPTAPERTQCSLESAVPGAAATTATTHSRIGLEPIDQGMPVIGAWTRLDWDRLRFWWHEDTDTLIQGPGSMTGSVAGGIDALWEAAVFIGAGRGRVLCVLEDSEMS